MALTRINNQALTNVTSAGLPSGTVLQVVHGELTSTVTKAPATGVAVDSGLSATIIPSSINSKILVQYSIYLGQLVSYNAWARIVRGSVEIGNATADGTYRPVANSVVNTFTSSASTNGIMCASNSYLDTPSTTSSTEYKIQVGGYNSGNVYVNRSHNFIDNVQGYDSLPISTITLMEIAG